MFRNLRERTKQAAMPLAAVAAFVLLSLFSLASSSLHYINKNQGEETSLHTQHHKIHLQKHIQIAESACQGTLYPDLCVSTLSDIIPDIHTKSLSQIISAVINHTVGEVRSVEHNCSGIRREFPKLSPLDKRAFEDCHELFDDTVSELKTTIYDLSTSEKSISKDDVETLLSGAMTNQYTCLDGFAYSKDNVRDYIEKSIEQISHHVSNSLAMVTKMKKKKKKTSSSSWPEDSRSGEVFPEYGKVKDGFPTWVKRRDRALLQAAANATKFDAVVAKDGSGNFTTIEEAITAAPNNSETRFVIHIKAGAYFENVEVDKKKKLLMLVGDGIGKTLIKGNRSVVDGWTTFRSATVAAVGNGFIAKGITFENYAGPSKHQAVAFRSGSDLSAFYQCSFVAYQDTLYVHSLRQFYRDCDVYGTVDFVFGNAAVVFQNCNFYARKPNENQKNIFTAQGREDPNQNTGISIIDSKIAAAADLIPVQSSFETYLGRPWKAYSRTVFLLSNIGDLVAPAGWLEWSGDFALKTLYYGEYKNRGPGSNTSGRVTWPGYRVINSSTEAAQFSVGNFIEGTVWIPATGIPFSPNLTSASSSA